jgi:hypothetical protein
LLLFYFHVIYITHREIIYHDSNVLRVFPAGVLYYITRARYLSFFFPFLARLKRIESLHFWPSGLCFYIDVLFSTRYVHLISGAAHAQYEEELVGR